MIDKLRFLIFHQGGQDVLKCWENPQRDEKLEIKFLQKLINLTVEF